MSILLHVLVFFSSFSNFIKFFKIKKIHFSLTHNFFPTDRYEHMLFLLFCHRCTDCQPGTTSSETALTCDPCPLATFSFLVGSPKCKDCNISEHEYADGIGSTQCRVCPPKFISSGSGCTDPDKLETLNKKRVPMAGKANSVCNVSFDKSEGLGCRSSNLKYCADAALAIFVLNSQDNPIITGCTENCPKIAAMKYDVRALFIINAADMGVEILAIISLVCVIVYSLNRVEVLSQRRIPPISAATQSNPMHATSTLRSTSTETKLKKAFDLVDTTQLVFGVVDCALQITALYLIWAIDDVASPFQKNSCLDLTTSPGANHHDTLTKLQESVSTSRVLGFVELAILGFEISIAVWEKYFKPDDGVTGIMRIEVIMLVGLQIFNTILAIVDFSVFSVNAQNDADSLYDVTNSETYRDWCVSVSTNSMSCIATQRSHSGGVSSAVPNAEVSSLLIVTVVIGAMVVGGAFRA